MFHSTRLSCVLGLLVIGTACGGDSFHAARIDGPSDATIGESVAITAAGKVVNGADSTFVEFVAVDAASTAISAPLLERLSVDGGSTFSVAGFGGYDDWTWSSNRLEVTHDRKKVDLEVSATFTCLEEGTFTVGFDFEDDDGVDEWTERPTFRCVP